MTASRFRRTMYSAAIGVIALYSTDALCASMGDVPQPLRKTAECMSGVLRKTPDIDHINLGVENSSGWVHPFLEYRAPADDEGHRPTIRFVAQKTGAPGHEAYAFVAVLPITFISHEPGPIDWGTITVAKKLQSVCQASVSVQFE
jgi:hypothetical protein